MMGKKRAVEKASHIAGTRDKFGRYGREGKLPPHAKQIKSAEDFELITWLIMR
jgi:hypothetical protein